MNATFSVIMPAYNVEKYIEDSINSVLNQTHLDFELIIVDDGSTDHTLEKISLFSDSRIVVIKQKNAGVAVARNNAIRNAKFEYIAFLDSDDLWDRNKLKNIADNLESGVGLYHSNVMVFTNTVNDAVPNKYDEPIKGYNLSDLILIYDFIITSSTVVPKKVLMEIGDFTEDFYGTEDWDLWIRISRKYKIKKINFFDCFYRNNAQGLSKRGDAFLKEEYKVIKKHLVDDGIGVDKIKNLAMWVWYKKNFYYSLLNFKIANSFKFFIKMLLSNPLEPANFDFIIRAFKRKN